MKIRSIFSGVAIDILRKSKDELNAQLKVLKNQLREPESMFILLAYGRSGSELLRNLINSHPDIYCDGEIFLKRRAVFPKRYLLNRAKVAEKKIYGYKAKLPQLQLQYKDDERLKAVFLTSDYKIIYLRRKNYLRQALSIMIGKQRNIWHDTSKHPLAGNKFQINCKNLLKMTEKIERYENREREMLQGLDYLYLNYEQDLLDSKNHQKALDKVYRYLGVKTVPVQTNYVRTTTDDISEFIENHREVIDTVKASKYADYLEK